MSEPPHFADSYTEAGCYTCCPHNSSLRYVLLFSPFSSGGDQAAETVKELVPNHSAVGRRGRIQAQATPDPEFRPRPSSVLDLEATLPLSQLNVTSTAV